MRPYPARLRVSHALLDFIRPLERFGRERHGYCCSRCGQQLLATLEELTRARWAEDGAREEEDAKKQAAEEKREDKEKQSDKV